MSKRIFNVVRPREGQDGKTYWDRHGVLVVDGDKISLKLESLPLADDWNGWFNVFEKDDQHQGQQQGQQQARGNGNGAGQGRRPPPTHAPAARYDDDVPF